MKPLSMVLVGTVVNNEGRMYQQRAWNVMTVHVELSGYYEVNSDVPIINAGEKVEMAVTVQNDNYNKATQPRMSYVRHTTLKDDDFKKRAEFVTPASREVQVTAAVGPVRVGHGPGAGGPSGNPQGG
jgi:hypothetical protein